jgi:hypothetical protein
VKGKNSSLVLLIFFLSAGGFLSLTALACGLAGITQVFADGSLVDSAALNLLVLGTFWCAFMLLPGIWYAIHRMQNGPREAEANRPSRLSGWLPFFVGMIFYPILLFLGAQVSERAHLVWWALPLLHIPAATFPVFALSRLALNRLDVGSGLRRWGVFGLGLTLGPGLIMVVELSLIFILVIGLLVQIASDQTRAYELMLLAQRLQFAQADSEIILRILQPYLSNPLLPFGLFAFVSVFVPLIEELLKPIGVWLLAGRQITPVQGFTAGILSGAGYALFENLFITIPDGEWIIVSVGRIGTTTMHLLTAGITGYALADAWRHNRYLRLGALYAMAVIIHAAWNGLTILSVAGSLPVTAQPWQGLRSIGQVAGVSLIGLYLAVLIGLLLSNHLLRRKDMLHHAQSATPLQRATNDHKDFVESAPDVVAQDLDEEEQNSDI